MATPTDQNPDLLTIVASMRAAPGKADQLRRELEVVVENARQQPGCVNYDLHEGRDEPGVFVIYENWESVELNEAHVAKPYLQHFVGVVGDLVDGAGLTITPVRRIA